jgi:hypothetical protein
LTSLGKFLKIVSVVVVICAFAEQAEAVTYVGSLNTGLGSLSWPNPHHYKNFIASGEYCTSTHFVCERPDFEIETASIADVPEFGDLPPVDRLKRKASYAARKSSAGQIGGSTDGGISSTSNPGDSPTGPFTGGGTANTIVTTNPTVNPPTIPTVNPPPNPPNPPPSPSPVPLPSSVWLFLAATLGLGVYRRQFRVGAQH